ncbi:unnamed protein product [Rhizoctonia solani]|uniref:DyP dimeric alpha+beta barrel domain-containing protein n=1 Tax=Rhizoctonia solani TaxID=456999 RepID=A0A8H3DST9_9AGAM|nr:unnamed protein product [Rhizoctonia solani]
MSQDQNESQLDPCASVKKRAVANSKPPLTDSLEIAEKQRLLKLIRSRGQIPKVPECDGFHIPRLKDIQGDVILRFPKKNQRFLFFRIKDKKEADFKKQLAEFNRDYATSAEQVKDNMLEIAVAKDKKIENKRYEATVEKKPFDSSKVKMEDKDLIPFTQHLIGFSKAGLKKLVGDVKTGDDKFDEHCMLKDKAYLGDQSQWRFPFASGEKDAQISTNIDGVISIASSSIDGCNTSSKCMKKLFGDCCETTVKSADTEPGETEEKAKEEEWKWMVEGKVRPKEHTGHEHFGFLDGISQPSIRDIEHPLPGQTVVDAGVIVMGYPGDPVPKSKRPDWAIGGTMMVLRKLQQDVIAFDDYCERNGNNEKDEKDNSQLEKFIPGGKDTVTELKRRIGDEIKREIDIDIDTAIKEKVTEKLSATTAGKKSPDEMSDAEKKIKDDIEKEVTQEVEKTRAKKKEDKAGEEDKRLNKLAVDLFAARFVGRWKSGAPLPLAPFRDNPDLGKDPKRNNDFEYSLRGGADDASTNNGKSANDPSEYYCPFAAHTRKMAPRNLGPFVSRQFLNASVIIRSGIPYGPEVEDPERTEWKVKKNAAKDAVKAWKEKAKADGVQAAGEEPTDYVPENDRGLLFVCYSSDLNSGFVRQTTGFGNNDFFPITSLNPTKHGQDPIIGGPPAKKSPQVPMEVEPKTIGTNGQVGIQPTTPYTVSKDQQVNYRVKVGKGETEKEFEVSGFAREVPKNPPFDADNPFFVTSRGGEYFFVPSIPTLEAWASSATA